MQITRPWKFNIEKSLPDRFRWRSGERFVEVGARSYGTENTDADRNGPMLDEAALGKVSNLSECTDKARIRDSFFLSGSESRDIQGAARVIVDLWQSDRSSAATTTNFPPRARRRAMLRELICHGSLKVELVTGRSNQRIKVGQKHVSRCQFY